MSIEDIEAWRAELIRSGEIVQDWDDSVSEEEAVLRCRRYRELAYMAEGTEGPAAVEALVASMRAEEDYGTYQAAHGALALFPDIDWGVGVALAASALVEIPFQHSGEVLLGCTTEQAARAFNETCASLNAELREALALLVHRHEQDGEWLSGEHARGRLLSN